MAGAFFAAFPSEPKVTEKTADTAAGEVRARCYSVVTQEGSVFLAVAVAQDPDGALSGMEHERR